MANNITDIKPTPSGFGISDSSSDVSGSLRARLQRAYDARLGREANPVGLVETLLAQEIARRAAQAAALDLALGALEQQSAQAFGAMIPSASAGQEPAARHLAPYLSGQYETLARQSIAASRGMLRAVNELREITLARRTVSGTMPLEPDPRFDSEAACCRYLLRRFQTGAAVCRRCGRSASGSWLAARRCWQCAGCRAQTCVRYGTVMERSHVPLTKWFRSIGILLLYPSVSAVDLAASLAIPRLATVRTIGRKIRTAIASDSASQLLAELDDVFLPG